MGGPRLEALHRLHTGSANAVEFHGPLVICAGALATTFACVGVCPAETCRIRMVAQPLRYATLGATVRTIAAEDGAATFYAGFRPLLVRQVIFGMVKFFFFDSLAEAIYGVAPFLHDDAASRLFVSLLAGLVAGSTRFEAAVEAPPREERRRLGVVTRLAARGHGAVVHEPRQEPARHRRRG